MIPAGFDYAAPATLDEALALLKNPGSRPLSGGTGLFPAISKGAAPVPKLVVDLRKIPGLDGIEAKPDGSLVLGARVRYRDAIAAPALRTPGRAVVAAALASHRDPQLRNQATLGGNLGILTRPGDLTTALLACDAKLTLARAGGKRELGVEEYLAAGGPAAGEVIVSIALPAVAASTGSAWEKFGSPGSGWAVVAVAAVVDRGASGSVSAARVALTGGGRAVRLHRVEKALAGGGVSAERIAAAVRELSSEKVDYASDPFASSGYRTHLAGVLVRRALERAGAA